jgi:hypothetical protein
MMDVLAIDGVDTVTGRSPVAVCILGERLPVGSWRDVVQATCQSIARLDEDRFDEIVAQLPRFFSRESVNFRASRQLANEVYMMTDLSGSGVNRLCVQVTQAAGLSPDDWKIEYA